ncbi:hypothetical protein V9779_27095, partial [Escherichia coli]
FRQLTKRNGLRDVFCFYLAQTGSNLTVKFSVAVLPELSACPSLPTSAIAPPLRRAEITASDITVFFTFFILIGFAPIFPDICYHLIHYKPAAADIPV